jgi:hypothetical protein
VASFAVLVTRGSRAMKPIVRALIAIITTWFRSRLSLQFEIVALRHQLTARWIA